MSFGPEVMLNVEVSRVMSFGHYSRAQPTVARDKCMFSDKLMAGCCLAKLVAKKILQPVSLSGNKFSDFS